MHRIFPGEERNENVPGSPGVGGNGPQREASTSVVEMRRVGEAQPLDLDGGPGDCVDKADGHLRRWRDANRHVAQPVGRDVQDLRLAPRVDQCLSLADWQLHGERRAALAVKRQREPLRVDLIRGAQLEREVARDTSIDELAGKLNEALDRDGGCSDLQVRRFARGDRDVTLLAGDHGRLR